MARPIDTQLQAKRRGDLLDAAAQLFAVRGYDASSTAAICEQAGMSSGNFFHYFPKKRDVLLAVVERERDSLAEALSGLRSDDPAGELAMFLDVVVAQAADPEAGALQLEISALARRDEGVRGLFRGADEVLRDYLDDLVSRGEDAGAFAPELSRADVVTWLAGLTDAVFARIEAQTTFDPVAQRATLGDLAATLLQPSTTH